MNTETTAKNAEVNSNDNFLPENYEAPKGESRFMKIKSAENKFRIMSKPVFGWLDWLDGKPVRKAYDFTKKDGGKPAAINPAKQKVQHTWAMIVWNYETKKLELLEISKATVITAITNLAKDKEWGAPSGYDLKITKSGSGKETEYTTIAVPPKEVHPEIKKQFSELKFDLNALFVQGGEVFPGSGSDNEEKGAEDDMPY